MGFLTFFTGQRKLPFVWQVSKDGIVSHLVGTHHYAPDVFGRDARKLVRGKDALLQEEQISEADFNYWSAVEYKDKLDAVERHFYTGSDGNKKFPTLRNSRENNILEQKLKELNKKFYGHKNIRAVDDTITAEAFRRDMPVLGLELPCESAILQSAYEKAPDMQDRKKDMELYLTGDLERIKQYHEPQKAELESRMSIVERAVEAKRNERMFERSVPYLNIQPCVVSVGLAHAAIDEDSLVRRYSDAGFEVRRL